MFLKVALNHSIPQANAFSHLHMGFLRDFFLSLTTEIVKKSCYVMERGKAHQQHPAVSEKPALCLALC